MKKHLLFAFALSLGLANVASAQGYTLVRDWKTNTTAAGADARQGCYANGKFYIQNRPAGQIEVWDQTGMVGTLPSTDKSTGVCADDAGNIIVTNVTEFDWGKESGTTRPIRIYAGGEAPASDIDIYLVCPPPASLSSDMRCDYFGHVQGDVMSEEGGELCWVVNRRKYLNILLVKNGAQDDDNSQAVMMDNCFVNPVESFQEQGSGISMLTQTVAFKFGEEYCFDSRYIGMKGVEITTDETGNPVATNKNDYTTAQSIWSYDPAFSCHVVGNTLFELGGEKYVVAMIQSKTDKERVSSFAIVKVSTGEKVAIWSAADHGEGDIVAQTAGANWITPVVASANTVELYQYFPAETAGQGWIAKYTFTDPNAGVEGVAEAPKAKVVAGQGVIRVEGEAQNIAVYSVSGALVSQNEVEVECGAGVYIVNVDGAVSKVIVR